jgi:hypothetical protein
LIALLYNAVPRLIFETMLLYIVLKEHASPIFQYFTFFDPLESVLSDIQRLPEKRPPGV